jgi:hypothetical protein
VCILCLLVLLSVPMVHFPPIPYHQIILFSFLLVLLDSICLVFLSYQDLMEATWTWDRLLPWTPGNVVFSFYSFYLNEFFYRNTPANFNTHDAARSVSVVLPLPKLNYFFWLSALLCSLTSLRRCNIMFSSVSRWRTS